MALFLNFKSTSVLKTYYQCIVLTVCQPVYSAGSTKTIPKAKSCFVPPAPKTKNFLFTWH